MVRTQKEGDRKEEDQKSRTEEGRLVWGGRLRAGELDHFLPIQGRRDRIMHGSPRKKKWSDSRCSINSRRVTINSGDNSGSCSRWKIF